MQITQGCILLQRFFDVADEIDLKYAEVLAKDLSRRPKFVGSAKQIRLPDPPLEVTLTPRATGFPLYPLSDVVVRIYNVGLVSTTFILELKSPLHSEELIAWSTQIFKHDEQITEAARPIVNEIMAAILPAAEPGDCLDFVEDYTIFKLQNLDPPLPPPELNQHLNIARLLIGEAEELAPQEEGHITKTYFSYYPDELMFINWNSALIYDKRDSGDVIDVLELTTSQLLALKSYDATVGHSLDALYNELQEAGITNHKFSLPQPQATPPMHTSPRGPNHLPNSASRRFQRYFTFAKYKRLSRKIMRLFIDVTKMSERINNSLQFLGDSRLTRIHRTAALEFDIPRWEKQLHSKMLVLQQINEHLVDQITTNRGFGLEIAIVLLILVEVIFAVLRFGH